MGVAGTPPVDGLGTLGGFKLQVEDRANLGYTALQANTIAVDPRRPRPTPTKSCRRLSTFRASVPQVYLDVDRAKAESMHVPLDSVWDTLSIYLGSLYVNDFTLYGRPYHVTAQADAPFRAKPTDVMNLKTRNAAGEMVPLGTLVKVKDINAPVLAGHYNMFPTAEITGSTGRRLQLRRGHQAHGGPGREGPSARHEDRMDRADPAANPGGQHRGLHLPALRPDDVPRAGRAIRELVPAAGDHPHRADVPALCHLRRLGARPGQ